MIGTNTKHVSGSQNVSYQVRNLMSQKYKQFLNMFVRFSAKYKFLVRI